MIYDVVIIGTGPAGYVCALQAAALGLKVCTIEKENNLGGTCLNVGCIPSKTLLYYSELQAIVEQEKDLLGVDDNEFDFALLLQKKREVVASLNNIVSSLFKQNGIDIVRGRAELTSPTTIKVYQNGQQQEIQAKNIVLATGSETISLPFLPIDEKVIVSSTGALDFQEVPGSLLVVGAGVVGVEIASVYLRLKTQVTVVELLPTICAGIDADLRKGLFNALKQQGIEFYLSSQVMNAQKFEDGVEVTIKSQNDERKLKFDAVLVAVGRRPVTKNLGLEKIGVQITAKGFVQIDANFRTSIPNIYAIGDIIEGPMLAHKASEEAVVVADLIAGKSASIEYITIPNVIYTFPEAATVGLSEEEVKAFDMEYKVGVSSLKGNARAKASDYKQGFVKVIADKKTDILLGMHILSPHASEMISTGMVALSKKATCKELQHLAFPHPTLSEAIKEACFMAAIQDK
jgi:dihydrolipoamide dehydrogenase